MNQQAEATPDQAPQNDAAEQSTGRRPDYIAYTVRDTRDGKGDWNKVGAAWEHRDNQGIDLQLDAVPTDGRVTLRELREERMNNYEEQRQASTPERNERSPSRGRSR